MEVTSFLFPLSITLLFETGIFMILKHRDLKLFLTTSIMNLVLNTLMNVILYLGAKDQESYWIILIIYEIATTLVESVIVSLFMKFKYLKVLLISFIANLTSFLIGLAFQNIYQNRIALIVLIILFFLGYLLIYLVVLFSFLRKQRENPTND